MGNRYLNVKDFAEIAGVSKQSIYKRLSKPNDPIQKYVSMANNHVAISIDALEDNSFKRYPNSFRPAADNPIIPLDRQDYAAERHQFNNMVSSMMDTMDVLKGQLAQKDRQIEELQQNLSKCINIIGEQEINRKGIRKREIEKEHEY